MGGGFGGGDFGGMSDARGNMYSPHSFNNNVIAPGTDTGAIGRGPYDGNVNINRNYNVSGGGWGYGWGGDGYGAALAGAAVVGAAAGAAAASPDCTLVYYGSTVVCE